MLTKKDFVETKDQRHKRFGKARERMDLWSGLLRDAYKYAIPDRDDWFYQTKGQNRMDDIFDSTAIVGVKSFATNIQSMLTPAYTDWAKLIPGDLINKSKELTDEDKKGLQVELDKVRDTLFEHLSNSNFAQKSHESLQDLAVGTAIMILNEGSDEEPFQFQSVPISQVAVSEGEDGKLENFWRKWTLPIRDIPVKWRGIKLSESMQTILNNNPDEMVEVIEGCVRYPLNDEDHQYYYYVQSTRSGIQDLLGEWREYSPFNGFRVSVSPGEILGRGPVLAVLPDVKVLNKMKEMILRGASLRAFPITLIENNAVVNPHKIKMVSGELITIQPSVSGKDPIRPFQVGGDVNFTQLIVKELEEKIRSTFGDEPLGAPEQTTGQSATQTNIRQTNWIRKNAAEASRLTSEWLNNILDKCLRILRKKNIIQDLVINGKTVEIKIHDKTVAIEYASPLLAVQDQEDAQKGQVYLEWLGQTFGPTGLSTVIDVVEFPIWMADKMGVPSKLINDSATITKKMTDLAKETAAAAQAQAQAGKPPIQTGQPAAGQPTQEPSPLGGQMEGAA